MIFSPFNENMALRSRDTRVQEFPGRPGRYSSSTRLPATQSNSPSAVRLRPPLAEGLSITGRVIFFPADHGTLNQPGCLGAMEQRTGLRAWRGSEFSSKLLIFEF
jgi:hypothetical protein